MLKKELIWREILHKCFEEGILSFTQKELAERLKVSLSTVNNALKLPRATGAIGVTGRNFRIKDKEKFLLLWASHHRLEKDIIYQTHVDSRIQESEGQVPPSVIFGAYSAYAKKYGIPSADYDTVYIYAEANALPEIRRRFPKEKGLANLFVLKADQGLKNYDGVTPNIQTFVDLWNLPQWYAKDFLEDLKKKLGLDSRSSRE